MLVSCSYCGGLHKRGTICESKPQPKKDTTKADRFRWSRRWRNKRKQINERDKYLCQVCLQEDKYNYTDLSVHHIDPIMNNWDRRLDDSNLVTLCRDHHEEAEDGRIKRVTLFKIVGRD